ncbi:MULTISPECIES: FAD-dependent oxidoreductase [Arthrobacter]|uniref:FAD-dependent oxidoreductase n=2 Tax=Arthrobacter TaxID=1663 RepID=A0ABU9KGX3_9MICC|nr:FAD-dependent oxidoreductase [Arthrobacter sp. YJM1]MDP5226149.1 FAD-dependent oxidoreductase [Arthrobacter sp. YJM1]
MFGLLHNNRLVFQSRREVGGDSWSFSFAMQRPFSFHAGQHGVLSVSGGGIGKGFSIASAPEEDLVQFGTSLRSGSAFKQRLSALQAGDIVALRGPLGGSFRLDGAAREVVMLGQGIGITPLRSMLAHAALTGAGVRSTLIHVASGGHAYRDETEEWATDAAYPLHAHEFRTATTAAAAATPGGDVLHRRRERVRVLHCRSAARRRDPRQADPSGQVPRVCPARQHTDGNHYTRAELIQHSPQAPIPDRRRLTKEFS